MAKDLYEPEVIQEQPFPSDTVQSVGSYPESSSGDTYYQNSSKEKSFPRKRSAVELLSTALNTRSKKILQEFELEQSGGLKVGNFESGITGDLKITPNGLTARDEAGITTFAIDGTDGSAVFKGSIQSGSLITGEVVVGNNRVIIGVDDDGQGTIIVNDGSNDRVLIGYQKDGF